MKHYRIRRWGSEDWLMIQVGADESEYLAERLEGMIFQLFGTDHHVQQLVAGNWEDME